VKFGDNEDYDFLEKINGTWSFADQKCGLSAEGYLLQRFNLRLNNIKDTGYYRGLITDNIQYADGQDFISDSIIQGYVHISTLDSFNLRGDFEIYCRSTYNSVTNRTIMGNFGIINRP